MGGPRHRVACCASRTCPACSGGTGCPRKGRDSHLGVLGPADRQLSVHQGPLPRRQLPASGAHFPGVDLVIASLTEGLDALSVTLTSAEGEKCELAASDVGAVHEEVH